MDHSCDELSRAEQIATMRKVTWRLIPLLSCCYLIAYVDRINVGFAKLHLHAALGVDSRIYDSVFGLGAGIFFIGYLFFEVPSNLILERVGARFWFARIMIVWGIVSMAFMFLKGVTMFYSLRFLLGAAEAGFAPGVLLYLTYWYPAKERAQIIALVAMGGVAAGVVSSPISGALLNLDGLLGLEGWQWLFFVEALPAILMGFVVLAVLPDRPQDARWLSEREKRWVQSRVDAEVRPNSVGQGASLLAIFSNGGVWMFCAIYFLMNMGGYGYEMWLPSIVKSLSGKGDVTVGFINAIPYFAAGVAMYWVGRNSDRTGETRWHIAIAALLAALGFLVAATVANPYIAMAGLTLAFAGMKSTIAPFWAVTTTFMSGAAAAGGIAFINSVGNLGGFFGPSLVGFAKDHSKDGNFAALLMLGGALVLMGVLALITFKTQSPFLRRMAQGKAPIFGVKAE
ncbi:MAG: MFS transporter [Verrucomicrobia bacterium]|nr:MAG: MFS transporter [Verrucomicrobiota bacterium]